MRRRRQTLERRRICSAAAAVFFAPASPLRRRRGGSNRAPNRAAASESRGRDRDERAAEEAPRARPGVEKTTRGEGRTNNPRAKCFFLLRASRRSTVGGAAAPARLAMIGSRGARIVKDFFGAGIDVEKGAVTPFFAPRLPPPNSLLSSPFVPSVVLGVVPVAAEPRSPSGHRPPPPSSLARFPHRGPGPRRSPRVGGRLFGRRRRSPPLSARSLSPLYSPRPRRPPPGARRAPS